MLGWKRQSKCSICDEDIPKGCGLRYRMKTKRYSVDGFYCNMPIHGVVCSKCLKAIKNLVLDYRHIEITKEVKAG